MWPCGILYIYVVCLFFLSLLQALAAFQALAGLQLRLAFGNGCLQLTLVSKFLAVFMTFAFVGPFY